MLTIKQMADYAGVTIKTVRHYHRIGLLAEPPRDEHGYRRYGAESLIELQRIRVLVDAGVPLARVRDLLDADQQALRAAHEEIDARLRARVRELERARRRLRTLVTEDEPFLPENLRRLVRRLGDVGLPDDVARVNRDGWLLTSMVFPDQVGTWVAQYEEFLADEQFVTLLRETVEARDWDPDDPRLVDLADRTAAWTREHAPETPSGDSLGDAQGLKIVSAFGHWTPAEVRLKQLIAERLQC